MAFGGVVLGALVVLALDGGRTNWIWLGCGVGAGLGAFVAQLTGNWPTGKSRQK